MKRIYVLLAPLALLAGCAATRTGEIGTDHPAHPAAAGYTCPMHPEVKSDKPGKCPNCKMELTAEKPAKKTGAEEKHVH